VVVSPRPPWLSSFHPLSTSRAVAREIGGGWCVVRYCRGALELVVLIAGWGWRSCTPIAPPVHRTSSGSWQWLGVLSSSVPFHPRSTPRAVAREAGAAGGLSWRPGAIRCRRRVVTRYPPSEQSCAGIEAGAGWSIVVVRCWGLCGACFGGLGG
jgi:hypothetical protein